MQQTPALRVLIVEDSTTDARIVQEYLRRGGQPLQTHIAARLSDALALAAQQSFDAVFLDISLPDTEGVGSVRRIRAALPGAPIVILSGVADEHVAMQAVQAGAQDYLIKGRVDEAGIRRSLQYALERERQQLLLRRIADTAGRLFATFDVHAMVDLLAAEARRLWGGAVALYGKGVKPDEFLTRAFAAPKPQLSEDGTRLAMPVPGTSGRNEWILDIRSASGTFNENDVSAVELLRGYTGVAIQNLALFGELQAQRASVLSLNSLKDDLIAQLAHDFKGPLTTILGFTDLLSEDALQGNDAQDALQTIRQSVTRLATLANDTLALSRIEQGDLNVSADPVNVIDVVKEAIEAHRTEREISLQIEARDAAAVRADPSRLRQVFDNLIGNAVKYSPGGDPVEVRVTQTESAIRIAVRDRGIGVPANEMKAIFERFRRASNAKMSPIKGTGLGLHLAKTLVERHGGTIQVQSVLNEGSTFTVVLPRMRDGVGGMLRVVLLTADEHLAPYVMHELRMHGQAVRHDKTLTSLLERLESEAADIVVVDCDSIETSLHPLFNRVDRMEHPIGLVGIGRQLDAGAQTSSGWHARLPNPFLAGDLKEAIAIADRARSTRPRRSKPE